MKTNNNQIFNLITFSTNDENHLNRFEQKLRQAIDFSQNLIDLNHLFHDDPNDLNIHLKPNYQIIEPIVLEQQEHLLFKTTDKITIQFYTPDQPFDDHHLKVLVSQNNLDLATVAFYNENNYHYGLIKTNGRQILNADDHFPNQIQFATWMQAIDQFEKDLTFKQAPKWKFWKR